jgi:hypothetical protein
MKIQIQKTGKSTLFDRLAVALNGEWGYVTNNGEIYGSPSYDATFPIYGASFSAIPAAVVSVLNEAGEIVMPDASLVLPPEPPEQTTPLRKTAEEWCKEQGFSTFDLLNLNRIEAILNSLGASLPPKCAQFSQWVLATQIAAATGADYTPAPATMNELMQEVAPILTSPKP